jgi:hypothetical protein
MKSAGKDIEEMVTQILENREIIRGGNQISAIYGTADNPNQHAGVASKTDGGFNGFDLDDHTRFNGVWEVGNWGNTLEFTPFEGGNED